MDSSALLCHVQNLEASLGELRSTNFGHPPPPKINVSCRLHSSTSLQCYEKNAPYSTVAVARTRRCVSAQLLRGQGDQVETTATTMMTTEPIRCILLDGSRTSTTTIHREEPEEEEEEEITCAAVLTLDHGLLQQLTHTNTTTNNNHDDTARGEGFNVRVAVVVGTNRGRVLSVEFLLNLATGELRKVPKCLDEGEPNKQQQQPFDMFEPIPLDTQLSSLWPLYAVGQTSIEVDRHESAVGSVEDNTAEHDAAVSLSDSLSGSTHTEPPPQQISTTSSNTTATTTVDGTTLSSSQHGSSSSVSAKHAAVTQQQLPQKKIYPFRPQGGVTSMNSFQIKPRMNRNISRKQPTTMVWVAYGDGTTLRLHHAAFFASILLEASLLEQLRQVTPHALVRCKVMIPPGSVGVTTLPLLNYHPSPLAPLPPPDDDDETDEVHEFKDAFFEALTYGSSQMIGMGDEGADDLPTLTFYTSENQIGSDNVGDGKVHTTPHSGDHEFLDGVIGGTKAIVGGVFGAAVGAVKWGFRGGGSSSNKKSSAPTEEDMKRGNEMEVEDSTPSPPLVLVPFPSIHDEPHQLFAGHEMHDAPRQVTSVSIDPEGNLVAVADTLGRVLLVDLSTKQVIRMWKGVREAFCYWIQVPRVYSNPKPWYKTSTLYLVIHSKQRRVVEVWRTRHGPRVKSVQVGRDAHISQCSASFKEGSFAMCFLVHSTAPGAGLNQIEALVLEEDEATNSSDSGAKSTLSPKESSISKSDAALRLQLLKQMLAETNVPSSTRAVYETFTQLTSLTDLCSALDQLSVAKQLEESMGVDGASFHSMAVSHCRHKFAKIVSESEGDILDNPHVKLLASKVKYHAQIVKAYEVLYKSEKQTAGEPFFPSNNDDDNATIAPNSVWTVEAMAWIDIYETVTGLSIDLEIAPQPKHPLRFSLFAKACSALEGSSSIGTEKLYTDTKYHVHFTDSTRTRTEILVHLFRPLLQDIFSYKTVNSIFDRLGLGEEYDYLAKCFGEWFMTLPARMVARKIFYISKSPIVRWLQEIVISQPSSKNVCLLTLYDFCKESPDLPKAFLLATLCREAVSAGTKQLEEKTYGLVTWSTSVHPWDVLIRKIRLCLLVTLRTHGAPPGAFPITVANIDDGTIFSVYEWIARDELFTSHNHDEIVSMEAVTKISGLIFHPSLQESDNPVLWKRLHRACTATAANNNSEGENDEKAGALLLYLSEFNRPKYLVAHRAMLLGVAFGKNPSSLQILRDASEALNALHDDTDSDAEIAAAIRIEVWQNQFRPVYRAMLFGFDDVPELSEDVMAPLVNENADWVREFHEIALELLMLITKSPLEDKAGQQICSPKVSNSTATRKLAIDTDQESVWPPVQEKDPILQRLLERPNRQVHKDALNLHAAVVCASLVLPDDFPLLQECVPDLYEAFQTTSLFSNATSQSSIDNLSSDSPADLQLEFVERAILLRAQLTSGSKGLMGNVLDSLDLGEIDILANIWNISLSHVKTTFLLCSYELSKDTMVDSLITSNMMQIDVNQFVVQGIDICCRRLNSMLHRIHRHSELRSVIGMLDADTCTWVKERDKASTSLKQKYNTTIPAETSLHHDDEPNSEAVGESMSNTHMFILRLLSLTALGAPEERVKIHSLSILSGTLLKACVGTDGNNRTL